MTGYVSLSLSIMGSLCTFLSCESPLATSVGELHQCSRKRMGRCSRRLSWKPRLRERVHVLYPIGSMYGIYGYIGGILMVNVTIYSIHGSYGYVSFYEFFLWHVPATHWYKTQYVHDLHHDLVKVPRLRLHEPRLLVDICWYLRVYSNRIFLTHQFTAGSPTNEHVPYFSNLPKYLFLMSAMFSRLIYLSVNTQLPQQKNGFQSPSGFPWKPRHVPQCSGVPGSSVSVGSFFSEVCCWDGITASFSLETLKIKATAQLVHTQPISTEVSWLFTLGISLFGRPEVKRPTRAEEHCKKYASKSTRSHTSIIRISLYI